MHDQRAVVVDPAKWLLGGNHFREQQQNGHRTETSTGDQAAVVGVTSTITVTAQ
jgi:hypothetical protein